MTARLPSMMVHNEQLILAETWTAYEQPFNFGFDIPDTISHVRLRETAFCAAAALARDRCRSLSPSTARAGLQQALDHVSHDPGLRPRNNTADTYAVTQSPPKSRPPAPCLRPVRFQGETIGRLEGKRASVHAPDIRPA